jgi:hypothetical protein
VQIAAVALVAFVVAFAIASDSFISEDVLELVDGLS